MTRNGIALFVGLCMLFGLVQLLLRAVQRARECFGGGVADGLGEGLGEGSERATDVA